MIEGPIEIVVLGFDDDADLSEIETELARLHDNDLVRLIDAMAVHHREHGVIETRQLSHLAVDEAMAFGAAVGALMGLGAGGEQAMEAGAIWGLRELADGHVFDDHDSWTIAERVPEGRAAVVALLEHRWRIPSGTLFVARAEPARGRLGSRRAPRRARRDRLCTRGRRGPV
ncbi:MAG: hypothetical protein U0R50_15290 [Gaiellales bacterium]